jgi:hypothetical protein
LRGIGLRALLGRPRSGPVQPFPGWIRPEARKAWGLEERWHRIQNPGPRAATRSEALVDDLQDMAWLQPALQQYEGAWGPMVVAHPYLDRRLLEFAIALPQYAARDKAVVRHALRGTLPAAVAARPKAHFRFDLVRHWLGAGGWRLPRDFMERVDRWVDPRVHAESLQAYMLKDATPWEGTQLLLPAALGGWLGNAFRASQPPRCA